MFAEATIPMLIDAAREGDLAACDELVRRHHHHIFATAMALVQQPQLAEDLAQEAFVLGFKKLADLRNPQLYAAWMRRLTRNLALDHLRRDQSKSYIGTEDLDSTRLIELAALDDSPSRHVEKWEMTRILLRAIARLPAKYRDPLILCYFDGASYQAAAEQLGLPLGSVKTLIYTSKEKLREILGSLADGKVSPPAAGPAPKLIILSDRNRGEILDLHQESYIIGRHPACDICFSDPTVSSRHCRLSLQEDGSYRLEDLGSTNGTWLNSQLAQSAILRNSDILQIGCLEIIFDRSDEPLTSALTTQTGTHLSFAVLRRLEEGDLPPGRRTASLGKLVIVGGRPQFIPA